MNNPNLNKFCVWLLASLLIACAHSRNELPSERRMGINGESIYIMKDDSVKFVLKEEYDHFPNEYRIMISTDTVSLGSNFNGFFQVVPRLWEVSIESPKEEKIVDDGSYTMRTFTFVPDEIGIYNFSGTLKYDSNNVPFEYKFVVVN